MKSKKIKKLVEFIYLITLIIMFLNFNEIIKLNRLIEGSLIFFNIILCFIYYNVLNKN
ncbi:hypothetical protein HMPREF0391_10563 [Finegoldia magna ATCC 53516]|uniref:Uncharacterized protein n=1 Tax=Finegoldia magna ATCC 53516 TaxID=525282 RepID=D6S7X7_FINMA|nr:hypothetical protein HMPREF0391_10563 [Finegoldia magna ATCC 53516]